MSTHYVAVSDEGVELSTDRSAYERPEAERSAWRSPSEFQARSGLAAVWQVEMADEFGGAPLDAVLLVSVGAWTPHTVTQLYPRPANADERLEAARRVLRADYWSDVRDVADDLKDAIARGHIIDTEDAETWLHKTIDGHQRVIYTGQAIEGLLYTDNESAFVDEFGEEGLVHDGDVHWSGLMYSALMADVRDMLGDIEELIEELGPSYCEDCAEQLTDEDRAAMMTCADSGKCATCQAAADQSEGATDYAPCEHSDKDAQGNCI